MADAKKCDRCSRYYNPSGGRTIVCDENHPIGIKNKISNSIMFYSNTMDLCNECDEEFHDIMNDWFNKKT